jgi:Flp pilus assembly protein TadB
MQLLSLKRALAAVWVSAALITGIAWNLKSVTSWTVLVGIAVIPPIVMMWRWNTPRQTMSESIQEARR